MKLFSAILGLLFATVSLARAAEPCPVCHGKAVETSTVIDDESKPSRNLSVWNRSICLNPFYGKGSVICLRDAYAYDPQLKYWALTLADRDSFAHKLVVAICEFPLPAGLPNGAVYRQEFVTLKAVKHGVSFWTALDEDYFAKIKRYANSRQIHLRIERHKDRKEAFVDATITVKSEL